MNENSISSINFVISAAYTFTFANSFFFMLLVDPSKEITPANVELTFVKIGCGIICLIMSLRFFFGNNAYIDGVMRDSDRGAWQKFYQFVFIALQSVILLICSYVIGQPRVFVHAIAILFVIETIWYVLTFIVDPAGVRTSDGAIDTAFFQAQVTNFLFWVSTFLFSWFLSGHDKALVAAVLVTFLLNTAYDAWKNMPQYMGAGSVEPTANG
jgi:hypothetical protein